ncbi:VWFA and cache domain-containing protein 1-like isoform X1 [Limulus polyphemus]|uniref:VWFA and cache domain-containing protein 1-like isoform X1 n=1 Tax=Limulus polyphemus TaxID=6850 RepID=A0ABM1SJD0_LIMPO|nr:VWFA and cache domain-containing protein 1-like isoform X1 [Limulus polyphemus]
MKCLKKVSMFSSKRDRFLSFNLILIVWWFITSYPILCKSELNEDNITLPLKIFGKYRTQLHGNPYTVGKEKSSTLDKQNVYDIDNELARQSEVGAFGGIYLKSEAKVIGSHLRKVSNEELGVTTMQAIFDSLPFVDVETDITKNAENIAKRLQEKANIYLDVLEKNKEEVETLYKHHQNSPVSYINPCFDIESSILSFSEHFGTAVSLESSCDLAPPKLEDGIFSPGNNLTDVFSENLGKYPNVKWQYFISAAGVHSEYPAHKMDHTTICGLGKDSRHRDVYLATVEPRGKHVMIIIDHGTSLSSNQLAVAKAVGKHILFTLSHQDKVGLIGLSGEPHHPQSDSCLTHQMAYATYETKLHFSRFIDRLQKTKNSTNHLVGFLKAFELLQNSLPPVGTLTSDSEALIIYISRGLLSSLTEARPVLEAIANENHKIDNRVIINTYAVIDDGKPIMYEKTFLKDIAKQNFYKYNVLPPDPSSIKEGMMVAVNSTKNLSFLLGDFYSVMSPPAHFETHFSLPWWDPVSKGLVVSLSQPVYYESRLLGVVGLDINLADLAEDVTYFRHSEDVYAFLIDKSGMTLMHPSFTRPMFVKKQPLHTPIELLENQPGFQKIREYILRNDSGEKHISTKVPCKPPKMGNFALNSADLKCLDKQGNKHQTVYSWRKVPRTPYIVCVVSVQMKKKFNRLQKILPSLEPAFVHHRLDLMGTSRMCRHIKQLSTLESSTLFLSASCFLSPFEYLTSNETKNKVQGYVAYLNDKTKLIANPGLKNEVRNDVLSAMQITPEWKKRVLNSDFSKYIVRRFVATPNGMFQIYPGTVIDKRFDPTKREWFRRAIEHPGRVVLTAPYLDVGGAGYIVTLSHTVYEGKHASMHSSFDTIKAVLGMDFTLGYFYKLLVDAIPLCEKDRVVCFIMDDKGYLIAHPGLIEPNGRGPIEQQHITHKEPLVANDIVNHEGFVKKKLCNSFSDRTVQRFYQFDLTLDRVLTNLVRGEHCAKYQITLVPGTNLYLGIVNQTCEAVTAFCPCSMIDRLCLNCHRMEQKECECPCECPLEMNLCTGQLVDEEDRNPSCPWEPEELQLPFIDPDFLEFLEPCFENHCLARTTESECFGVLGCEWCQMETDGVTQLKKSYCVEQRKCFGGVLGARTPYADEIIEGLPLEELLGIKSTPVGPVAGGIMGCFLVLALAFYCYRHHVQRGPSPYMPSAPNTTFPMSQLDNEPDETEFNEDLHPVAHSNVVLQSFENAVPVSPYRANSAYRRPAGGESDHGYSTMTPHEDSEHMPPYFEPLLIGKDWHHVPASQQSVSSCSRASSPVPHPHPHSVTPPISYYGIQSNRPWASGFSAFRDPSQTVIPEVPYHSEHLTQAQIH